MILISFTFTITCPDNHVFINLISVNIRQQINSLLLVEDVLKTYAYCFIMKITTSNAQIWDILREVTRSNKYFFLSLHVCHLQESSVRTSQY